MSIKIPAAAKAPAWLVVSCLLIVYVVWGTTYFAIKVAIEGIAPFFLVGTRFVTAGVLLLGWQALRGAKLPTARQWVGAALVGFLLLVAGNGAVAVAEHWVSSGATVALISTMPLATALWSGVFGEWPRRTEWIAIALGGAGAAIMLLGRDLQGIIIGTSLILFVTMISLCFKRIGIARKSVAGDRKQEWLMWLLGVALFGHVMVFFGVSYWDQMWVAWASLLVIITTATANYMMVPVPAKEPAMLAPTSSIVSRAAYQVLVMT